MKNSIKIIGSLALVLSVVFACKKEKEEVKIEDKQMAATVLVSAKAGDEKAIVVGTDAQLKEVFSANRETVILKKASEKNNLFIPVTGTVGPVDPVDPSTLCWDEIHAYYEQHYSTWQNTANQNCSTVYVCLTCPNAGGGLYVLYAIKPNSIKCAEVAYAEMPAFKLFTYGKTQYDSEAVSAYIRGK